MIIFVTGKSGSGKSTVAKMLAEKLNYKYIDVDIIGHKIYNDKTLLNKVINLFGEDILDNGVLNRKKLGAKLFAETNKNKVEQFNQITGDVIQGEVESYFNQNIVVDWVLLPKTRFWNVKSIKILVKSIDNNVRYDKLIKRDNVSLEYLKIRERGGIDYLDSDFNYVVVNNYNLEDLTNEVLKIYNNIKEV